MITAPPVETLVTDHLDLWTTAIKRKSTAGRGSSSKVELYGIKKLRALILELAVRGLLVPQDPNDEPASELLKKIAVEKAKPGKAGKAQREMLPVEINDEKMLFALPKSWTWICLGDLAEVLDSQRKPITKTDRNAGPYPYYGASGIVDYVAEYIFDEPLVLVGEDGAKWGRGDSTAFAISGMTWVNNHAHVLRPNRSCVLDSYLVYFLTVTDLNEYITGMTVPKLNQARLISIPVVLPPLAEQHRIVAKIDELMALCDQLEQQTDASLSAHQTLVETLLNALTSAADHAQFASGWQRIAEHFDTLFTTDESIAQLKQTLLELAVMGKLVPQDPNDEPASELLKKIAAEKAKLVKEGKIKKEKPLPPIGDEKKPFELPKGWAWARFPELGEFGRGKSKHRPRNDPKLFNPGLYPLVQTGEVARANGVIAEYHSKYSDIGLQQSKMWPAGTLCITIAANIADAALLGFDACFPDSVVGFVPIKPLDDASYLLTFMKTARAELLKFAPATAQKNINLEILESVLIPLPPRAEVARISSKVAELIGLCDQLKSRLSEAQTTQLHLADALTEKALARA